MASRLRIVLALGSTQTLAWGSTYYLPAILAAPMGKELGLSASWVYGAFSVALVIAAVLGPLAGRWIDARGGRNILAASNLTFALGLLLMGSADSLVALCLAWTVIGAGMAMGLYEAAFSTLAGIYGHGARGPITGITLLAGFASTICWPITALIEVEAGWRMACYFWAGAHLLFGLPLNRLLLPRGIPAQESPQGDALPGSAGPSSPLARNGFAMAMLSFVFAITWFTSTAMAAHLPRLLQEAGATPAAAIAAAALVGPAQVAARLFEFGLLRRCHPLISARLAAAAHPLGAVAVMVFGAPAAAVFAVLHGAGNGILTIAKGTLPLAIFGPRGYGLRQGVLMVPARFCQAGAPLLFAVLMERFGASALLLSTGLGLAGLAALFSLTPTPQTETT